ncbi:MAG TPA: glycerol-3-phosphate dehydrogenase/oxidase [Longimicrobiales bacterium]|nr:glycerol-3-phosphate dehydrogenase/oxidase [Longimicrobiales bacterium]
MNREHMLGALDERDVWDFIVVGGGATGLGVAIDAASRGYATLLLEQDDFAKGTSSRSTKLVHGGVRYLQQGNVSLVIEALRERGLLLANAPHLVRNLSFVVPNYDWWEGPFYGIGLKMYDLLAGKQGLGRSKMLSRRRTLQLLPTLESDGLNGGVIYYDGQFDDARLAVAMALTAADHGATVLNRVRVEGLLHNDAGEVSGVAARDVEADRTYELRARAVVNATGVWSDGLRRMDDPGVEPVMVPSQGVHIVLDRDFLPGESAIMVPKTEDGRVLFAIPWQERVVVGTTDTALDDAPLEPRAREEEIEFLLHHAALYLDRDPKREDVRSVWAGIRPLVGGSGDGEAGSTSALSRDHSLIISNSGLVTITGGKWTTYRNMAEDTVDQAAVLAGLDERECVTKGLRIHGWHARAHELGALAGYGTDAVAIRRLADEDASLAERIHPGHAITGAQVVWAAREEMARGVEDVLSRRTRLLLLDARAALDAAPRVAELLAAELGRDEAWTEAEVVRFRELAEGYLPTGRAGEVV